VDAEYPVWVCFLYPLPRSEPVTINYGRGRPRLSGWRIPLANVRYP
jgi:hypothetical protein